MVLSNSSPIRSKQVAKIRHPLSMLELAFEHQEVEALMVFGGHLELEQTKKLSKKSFRRLAFYDRSNLAIAIEAATPKSCCLFLCLTQSPPAFFNAVCWRVAIFLVLTGQDHKCTHSSSASVRCSDTVSCSGKNEFASASFRSLHDTFVRRIVLSDSIRNASLNRIYPQDRYRLHTRFLFRQFGAVE